MSKNQNLTDNADNKPQNTKKKILTAIGIAAAILLLGGLGAGLFLLNRGGGERDSSSVNISGMPRENVLDLAKRYISRGEYDRAMDLLDALLLQNPSDADALAMLDEIIALKQGVPLSNFPRYSDVPSYSLDDLQRLYAQQNQSADELDKLIAELSAKQDSLTPEEQQRLAELQKRREEIAQANKEMSQLFELLQQLQEQSAADRAKLDELLQKQSSSGLSSAETARINELLKEQQEQMAQAQAETERLRQMLREQQAQSEADKAKLDELLKQQKEQSARAGEESARMEKLLREQQMQAEKLAQENAQIQQRLAEEQAAEPERAQHSRTETPRRPKAGASRKDCRLNMLVTRKMRDQIQALADIDEKSVNSFLNDVIAAYIDSRREEYEQYSKAAAKIEAIRRAKREGAGQ